MIRVAVVEDERGCQEQICGYLKRYGEENELEFQTTVFSDGLDIVENYNPVWDIIFMDIRMKHMDGMTAAAKSAHTIPGRCSYSSRRWASMPSGAMRWMRWTLC